MKAIVCLFVAICAIFIKLFTLRVDFSTVTSIRIFFFSEKYREKRGLIKMGKRKDVPGHGGDGTRQCAACNKKCAKEAFSRSQWM